MTQKSRGILLLVLVVLLLVVVSSRISPTRDRVREAVRPTDDPYHEVDETAPSALPSSEEPTETELPVALLPEVSLSDWNLKLVNNEYVLPSSFAPAVTDIGSEQYFDSRAVDALNSLLAAVREAGYSVCIRTAYRPYSTQAYLFFGRASQIQWGTDMEMIEAEELARKVVAYPGTSEHQLALAVDLMDSEDTSMDADTAKDLPVLKWLAEHCAEYGFILRYPENKQEITSWFEPWHFRYVGEESAAYIMDNDLCLEEFVALY